MKMFSTTKFHRSHDCDLVYGAGSVSVWKEILEYDAE